MKPVFEVIKKDDAYHKIKILFENSKYVVKKRNSIDCDRYKMIICEGKKIFFGGTEFFNNYFNRKLINRYHARKSFVVFGIEDNEGYDFESMLPWIDGVIHRSDDKYVFERKLYLAIRGYKIFGKPAMVDAKVNRKETSPDWIH